MNLFNSRSRRSPSQTDLIAFHLGELSPRRRRSVLDAIQSDAAVAAESEALATTLRSFPVGGTPPQLDDMQLERSWLALLPSLPTHAPRRAISVGRRILLAGCACTAMAAIALLILLFSPQHRPVQNTTAVFSTPSTAIALAPDNPNPRNPFVTPFSTSPLRRSALALVVAPTLFATHSFAQSAPLATEYSASSSWLSSLPEDAAPAFADPATPGPSRIKPLIKPRVESSISLGVAPQLTATRLTGNYAYPVQSLDPSPAVLGTFRQSFRPLLGYSVNFGYSRVTQHNIINPLYVPGYSQSLTRFDIPANMYELSVAYMAQKHITPKLTGFVDVGAGMVSLLPVHRGADAANYVPNNYPSLVPPVTFRPAGVGGVGVDYRLSPKLALRAEYRGLLYKYADYGVGLPRAITVSSEPTVSLTYTFHHHP